MYIIKNAFRNIVRTKMRSVLIGIIVLIISVSVCLGLSIRQAAEDARESSIENLKITAQISLDRSSMMKNMESNSESESPDRASFAEAFANMESLTIDDMLTYAKAESVSHFYYTASMSVDGSNVEPVSSSTEDSSDTDTSDADNMQQGAGMPEDNAQGFGGFRRGGMGQQGDFTITGYSSEAAMTDFANGTSSITDGRVFEEGTSKLECIISEELASYNSLSVGDKIKVANPNNEDEKYKLTIVGIYQNTQSGSEQTGQMMFSTASDMANQIYMSYDALQVIKDKSEDVSEDTTDETTGITTTTAMPQQLSGTYEFATIDDYNQFEEQARELGLSEDYIISSSDVSSYEQSMVPLENLSEMAGYFLIVVLIIGMAILVVLNIFNIRERKYEVGVLTAIGMKKWKVAVQFVTEILVITTIAVIIGGGIGAVSSVSVTNSLLASQVEAQQSSQSQSENAFGRGEENMMGPDSFNMKNNMTELFSQGTDHLVSEVNSAVNIEVLLELLGICVALAGFASLISVIFIMRYEPLKILSNRD